MIYKSILVTGGAGFIGSNIAVYLKEKHPQLSVLALDNLKRRGSELNIRRLKDCGIEFLHGDIRCREDLVIPGPVDLLIECSAEPSVLAGFGSNPGYIINTNLLGTINCLELARHKKSDIIFLSTSRVYPYGALNAIKSAETATRFIWKPGQSIPGFSSKGISEDFTVSGPKTLYGATKLSSELLISESLAHYGVRGVINRCGVVAGPWQFGKVDQGVFTLWMSAHYFKRGLKYIGFGAAGKQVRDLLAISDLCRLIHLQMQNMPTISGRVYNVGGGLEVSLSLRETTELCRKITGNRITIGRDLSTRPGDVKIYITDNSQVTKELGWKPQITSEAILTSIYEWIRENEGDLSKI